MAVFPSYAIRIPTQAVLLAAMIGAVITVAFSSTILEQLEEINPTMVMLSPLILLIIIRWLSSTQRPALPAFLGINNVDSSSIHRMGGSPFGVAFILLIVLVMIWYQSSGGDEEGEE